MRSNPGYLFNDFLDFLRGFKVYFFVQTNNYIVNFYLNQKENEGKFVNFDGGFKIRENMWRLAIAFLKKFPNHI